MKKLIAMFLLVLANSSLIQGKTVPVMTQVKIGTTDTVRYHKNIVKADNAFCKGKYLKAKRRYQKALSIQPLAIYPKQMIRKCDSIIATPKPIKQ